MTTIDVSVAASGDDARVLNNSSAISNTLENERIGQFSGTDTRDMSARFLGISGLAGAAVDVSYFSLFSDTLFGTPGATVLVSAEDAPAPAAPTSYADFVGRALTTASVSWTIPDADGFTNSPSLNAVLQELADHDPSVIQIFVKNNAPDTNARNTRVYFFDHNVGERAPALHIEYTAGSPPVTEFVPSGRSVSLQYVPVPDDWDEETDGYCTICAQVPNSTKWRMLAKGLISALMVPGIFDAATGDQDEAAKVGYAIYKSIEVDP